MIGLTEKQASVLLYLVTHGRETLRQPTLGEVGEHFGITKQGAAKHLSALQAKGFVESYGRGPRGILITKRAFALIESLEKNDE